MTMRDLFTVYKPIFVTSLSLFSLNEFGSVCLDMKIRLAPAEMPVLWLMRCNEMDKSPR